MDEVMIFKMMDDSVHIYDSDQVSFESYDSIHGIRSSYTIKPKLQGGMYHPPKAIYLLSEQISEITKSTHEELSKTFIEITP